MLFSVELRLCDVQVIVSLHGPYGYEKQLKTSQMAIHLYIYERLPYSTAMGTPYGSLFHYTKFR